MNESVINQYAGGGAQLFAAIEGLSHADFAAIPVKGTWSIGQIVLHLMDSDLIATDRMKAHYCGGQSDPYRLRRIRVRRNLFYDKLDPFIAADILNKNRQLMTIILRSLPPSAFDRMGIHSERGPVSLTKMLDYFTGHIEHHVRFIREKRALLNKPMQEG